MECVSQMWSIVPCLWDCTNKHAAYISGLEDNLNSLSTAMVELKNLSQDVKNRVHVAEQFHRRLGNQVNGWLLSVEDMEKKVNPILQKGAQEVENKCVGSCCPKNCWSSHKLSKKVLQMIPQVTGLIEKGYFGDVADDNLVAAPVDELPMEGPVVGFESKFGDVWQAIQDKDSSFIGLVGIGGVGKTTLLKQLNNEFLKTGHGFDLVIWIVVSKPASLERIQETIRNKLNISDRSWQNKGFDERAILIFNILKGKKFVVLLDDLWDGLELSEVGIPQPCKENMSKVVFTTRSQEVCRSMDAHKSIRVDCLPPNQALNLFCSKVGEEMLKCHPELQELVKDVASECDGLPLALITIGRSMRGKIDAQQWKDAKRTLETYPSTFPGVKGRVFSRLLFSYDNLATPILQKCFEYCSIFPEDHNIGKEELIRLWIVEGIIDEYVSMYDALIQGRQIIDNLMQACLLEVGESYRQRGIIKYWEETVKMHDVIRDMALWLACERGEKKNKFFVHVVSGDGDGFSMAKQRNAEKVSLGGPGTTFKTLTELSFCSNLVTLIIRNTKLEILPTNLFQFMKTLKVLDLSENQKLMELPIGIGGLINLEYLNIIDTIIIRFPEEALQLKKLRFLLVSQKTFLGKAISSFESLQTFDQNMEGSGYMDDEDKAMERETLEELEKCEQIMDLCLTIRTVASIQTLLNSPKLQTCTRQLSLDCCESLSATVLDLSPGKSMQHLERLNVFKCDMSVIKFGSLSFSNLRHISIIFCESIHNLSSLVSIRNLCTLYVAYCKSMEELIGENGRKVLLLLSSLTSLTLKDLPKLRSICPQRALPFPSMKEMSVYKCYDLKNLPLDSNTAKTAPPEFKIVGERLWWDSLQWDSQATKDAFSPNFQLPD